MGEDAGVQGLDLSPTWLFVGAGLVGKGRHRVRPQPAALKRVDVETMTAAALVVRVFGPPAFRPVWLRPAAVAAVVALPASAVTHSSGDADLDAAARQSAHFPPPRGGVIHIATSFNYVAR